MDPTVNFICSEITVAYTLLWGACLHHDEEDQQLFRLQAKAAYDTARESLSRISYERRDLIEPLRQLGVAISDWSIEECAWFRDESYRRGSAARQY